MKDGTKIKRVSGTELSKKKLILLGAGGVFIALILVFVLLGVFGGKEDSNFFTVFNKMLSTKVGNFRYVIEVQTSEYEVKATAQEQEMSVEEMTSVEGASDETNGVSTDAKHQEKLADTWSNTEGSSVIDWTYPNYRVVIDGRTESINPMRAYMSVEVSTPYSNGMLFDATIVDGTYYINLLELRNWLSSSTDKKLADLAKSIPESAVYLVMNEDEIHFYSTFAEDSEYEISGTYNFDEFYNRFLILEQTLVSSLGNGLPNNVYSTQGTKYGIDIKGDNAILLYSNIKSCLNNSSSMYSTYIKNLQSNGQMTDEQAGQAVKERDNFLSYISDKWVWLNSASTSDLTKRNLNFSGVADQYANDNGENTYEADFVLSYTDTQSKKNISISFSGAKTPLSSTKDTVSIPTGATSTKDELGLGENFTNLTKTIIDYFDILDLFEEVKLEKNAQRIVDSMLDDFIDCVNENNLGVEGFVPITKDSAISFIEKYKDLEGGSSKEDKFNTQLVKGLLTSLNDVTGSMVVTEVIKEEAEIERFREVTADVTVTPNTVESEVSSSLDSSVKETEGTYKIIANVNEEESNTNLVVIDAILLNTSDHEMVIDLSRLSVQDMTNNKYPCNYETKLHEYDNGFDMSNAPVSVTIPVGGYVQTKLYSVIENGWRYYDLFSSDTKLGDIVAY